MDVREATVAEKQASSPFPGQTACLINLTRVFKEEYQLPSFTTCSLRCSSKPLEKQQLLKDGTPRHYLGGGLAMLA